MSCLIGMFFIMTAALIAARRAVRIPAAARK